MYYRERHLAMAELNKDADAQIAQSEKDYDQAQELLRGFQASGEIDSLSQAAQLMVGVLGTFILCVFSLYCLRLSKWFSIGIRIMTKHICRLVEYFPFFF